MWSRLSTPCAKAGSSTMSAGLRIRVCSAIAPRSGRRPRPGSTGATPPAPPRTGRHRAEASAEPTRKNKKESGLNHFPQNPELDPSMEAGTGPHGDGGLGGILLQGRRAGGPLAGPLCGHGGVKTRIGTDNRTIVEGDSAFGVGNGAFGVGNGAWGYAVGHWGRQRVIGAGNGAFGVGNGSLGQVNNLPQCGLTCPNAANVPQCDSRRPGGRGARDGVCFHSDASGFTAVPHFASVITLAKWRHPFEDSASLAKQPTASTRRARLPFESTTSLAKRPRSCPDRRTFQRKTPPRWDGRPYSRGSAFRSCSYPPGVMGWPPLWIGDPRSRLVGVVRGSPIVGRLCPGSSPGSQRGAVGLRTDPDRERARTVSGPGPRADPRQEPSPGCPAPDGAPRSAPTPGGAAVPDSGADCAARSTPG
mgnify:CR=1 FL=1